MKTHQFSLSLSMPQSQKSSAISSLVLWVINIFNKSPVGLGSFHFYYRSRNQICYSCIHLHGQMLSTVFQNPTTFLILYFFNFCHKSLFKSPISRVSSDTWNLGISSLSTDFQVCRRRFIVILHLWLKMTNKKMTIKKSISTCFA